MRAPNMALLCIIAFAPACKSGSDSTSPGGGAGQTIASITLDHVGDSLDVGGTVQLTAVVHNAQGGVISGQAVTWTSTDRNVLDVSTSGLVTALFQGSASIGASIGPVLGNASLRVRVPAAARYALDTIATSVLGPSSIGQLPSDSTGTADAAAIELPDKRVRVYFGYSVSCATCPGIGTKSTIGSAISSDGVHFTVESGLRQPAGTSLTDSFGGPLIYALPSGGYRLFYGGCNRGQCGIGSSTSTDGLSFVADTGSRLPAFTSLGLPNCSGIAKLASGKYRIYCTQDVQLAAIGPASASAVFSATSPDLLNWTPDAGRRIGQGAPTLTNDAKHPTVIMNADGSISLLYYQRRLNATSPREMISTSTDGLTFTTEYDLGFAGTEPSFVKRSDGSMLLYYGGSGGTNAASNAGSVISVARVTLIVR